MDRGYGCSNASGYASRISIPNATRSSCAKEKTIAEHTYIGWIRRFIHYHAIRHPDEMGATEVVEFLTHLAVERNVAASTQNQALSAIVFLYKEVLGRELVGLDRAVRARDPPSRDAGALATWVVTVTVVTRNSHRRSGDKREQKGKDKVLVKAARTRNPRSHS